MAFTLPSVEFVDQELDGNQFSAIVMNGEAVEDIPGAPDIPRIVRMVMVDNEGNYGINLNNVEFSTSLLPHRPLPYVPLAEGDNALDGAHVTALPEYYEQNEWYPQDVVRISEPATLRDVRFVLVTVFPVQVNPVTHEVRTYTSVDITVENHGGHGANEITHTPRFISPAFKELYRTIPNFEGSWLDELPVLPGSHLYVCDPNATVVAAVQQLVDWRRKRGIDAHIATLTDTGPTSTNIRDYIVNEFAASNGALEYVTLVGDPGSSAPLTVPTGGTLDNFYAIMGGGNPDPVPDLAVGRFPATTTTDLGEMINNVIDYESNPYMTDTGWYERAWCAAHTSSVPSNPSTKEYMRQMMLHHGMPTVYFDVFGGHINTTTLQSRLNGGVCFFNDRMSWISEFTTSDLSGVNVGPRLPSVWVVTCATGTFSSIGSALNEEFVRGGHSIGCVGMSGAGTHSRYNNILDGGGMQTIFVDDVRETGMAVVGAKLELYRNYWDVAGGAEQPDVTNFAAWCNLQGDPGVPVFLARPQTLSVTHPTSVSRGTNNINVTVMSDGNPVANALVGLVKGTETFSRGYTDAAGQINLATSLPTTGTMYITVTGKDLYPYQGTISVVSVGASLAFSSIGIDDDNTGGTVGDNNDILNPGETVDLDIVLQNTGTSSTVTGITGTLTSATPGVSIVNGVQSYPNIGVGATGSPTSPFRVSVGAVFNNEPATLYLSVNSSAGNQTVRVDLTPEAASVAYSTASFPDGNNRLDPGDTGTFTVTINNDGSRALSSASAILRSLSQYVVVNDSLGTYGNVSAGGNANNSGNPFNVSALITTPAGYQAPMQLVVTDVNGVRDSTNFLQAVGIAAATSPTGPDAYGYIAYENSDTQPPGAAPQFEWIEICPGLGGTGTSLGFTDGGEDQDDISTRVLPFSFQYYGQSYDTITICSNGWVAFGNTTQIDYRNYHIASPLGPPNMIGAYWDDLVVDSIANGGVYVKSDAANGRYIIEWITRCMWTGHVGDVPVAPQVFQVILYSQDAEPSPTGDGKILVQYQVVTPHPNSASFDNDYATVGIQNYDHTQGLEICYWNAYTPGSTTLVNGRAIMYTTDETGVVNPHFALLSPNGGELWLQDSTVSVVWSPGLVTGNVNIDLSRNGVSGPWTSIVSNTANDGQYTFAAPAPTSATCRVRLTSIDMPDSTDISAGDFTIATVLTVMSDDFESGAAGWTHTSPNGWGDQWHISTEQANSPTHSYKCGDTGTGTHASLLDAQLTSAVVSAIPENAVMQFEHIIDSELSSAFPDSAYDGGWVEISVDGAPFETIYPLEGYPKTTRYSAGSGAPYSGPVPGQPCYAGSISEWATEQFDLSAYAGSDVQFRWRFASDGGTNLEGWYIDDVQVYGIGFSNDPTIPIAVVITVSGEDVTLSWEPDGNPGYRVFSSTTSDFQFPTLEAETTSTSVTLTGNASVDLKKFYYVVGWNGQ
ncbi:MAG: immune inhibitor A [Calditrichaeota bacterium]|nr:immune inhibitor A [Calditrichota bacterium]